ncbi:MAG: hypothetical protein EHM24_28510, partial [Acidobacteria bacterium]
ITPASASPGSTAGSQIVALTGQPAGCVGGAWIATGDGSWLSVTPGSGTGPGPVTVRWTANTSAASRSGTATIADNPFAVAQDGTPPPTCSSFSVMPASLSPGAAAGSQVVTVTGVPAGCAGGAWTAAGNGLWLTASPASGSGPGSVTLSWTANTSASSRSANATVAASSIPVTQAGAQSATCTSFSISPGWVNTPAAAGSQEVSLTGAPAGCSGGDWTASGKDLWVTVSPASGSGPGTVTVSWAANASTAPRWSSAAIAGRTFSVTQFGGAPQTCSSFSISPSSATPPHTSGSQVVTITGSPAGCTGGSWSAAGNASWVSVLPASSSGPGSVMVMWTANASMAARSVTATIAGNPFPIQQAGVPPPTCSSFSLAPASADATPAAGSQLVTLTGSPSSCAGGDWTAVGNGSWLTVSPAAGSGPSTVTVQWTANRSTSPRSASATIAGTTFQLRQTTTFPACAVVPSPVALSFPTGGGTGSVTVQADAGCAWDVQTTAPWIEVGSAGGTGPGAIEYTVSANPEMGPRTATVTVGGAVHTVTQESICNYTLSATSRTFTDAGGADSVSVATGPACTWTVTTEERWIGLTTAGGTGVGTASFVVAPNTLTRVRTGTLTIGEATLTISQDAFEGTTRPSLPVSRYNPSTAE